MLATSACDPSPPAMPITSAPRSIAPASQVEQVVARSEDHRLDTPLAAFVFQVEPFRLPASGLQVHDQDPVGGRGNRGPRSLALFERAHVATEGEPREGDGEQQRHDADEQRHRTAALLGDPDDDESRERGEGDEDGDRPAADPRGSVRTTRRARRRRARRAGRRRRGMSSTTATSVATTTRAPRTIAPTAASRRLISGFSADGIIAASVERTDGRCQSVRSAAVPMSARVSNPTPAPTHRPPITSVSQ